MQVRFRIAQTVTQNKVHFATRTAILDTRMCLEFAGKGVIVDTEILEHFACTDASSGKLEQSIPMS